MKSRYTLFLFLMFFSTQCMCFGFSRHLERHSDESSESSSNSSAFSSDSDSSTITREDIKGARRLICGAEWNVDKAFKRAVEKKTETSVMLALLDKFGAILDKNNAYDLCTLAIHKKNYGGLEFLLTQLASANFCNPENKRSILHYAARRGNIKAVEILLNKKAKVNAKDKWSKTPLDRVNKISPRKKNRGAIKELLVAHGGIKGNMPIESTVSSSDE